MVATTLLMFSLPLVYVPLFFEEFETPKAWLFISFACLSLVAAPWKRLRHDRVAWALVFFTLSAAVSASLSIDWRMSVFGNPKSNNGLLVQASYLVFYLMAASITSIRARVNIMRVVMAAGFIVAAYAILQVFGIDFQKWENANIEITYFRPMSTLGHPNFMAAYLSMVLSFALYRFERGLRTERALSGVVILACLAGIVVSQSRGMWLATAAGLAVYFWCSHYRLKEVAYLGGASALIACVVVATVPAFRVPAFNRLTEIVHLGNARTEYPMAALRIWKHYPVFGAGTDAYEVAFDHQRSDYYWRIQPGGSPHRAHMEFFNILATQGLLGGLCALFLTLEIVRLIRSRFYSTFAPMIAAVVAFYVQELSSFHVVSVGTLFLMAVAFLNYPESL